MTKSLTPINILKVEPKRIPDKDVLRLKELIERVEKGEVLEFAFATRESNGESHQVSSDVVKPDSFKMYGILVDFAHSYRERNIE